ncbi:MAG: PEP-CTERM sorting domain-containing protein [Colwellia sp.]|nr:PEP-CTERM sorting domain-containing protein [Colwellia sp.]
MKKLITATALLLASSAAFATPMTYTETASFGTLNSIYDELIGPGPINKTITVDGFDNALGTLTDITVSAFGQVSTGGDITNISPNDADARAYYNLYLYSDFNVNSASTTGGIFAPGVFTQGSFTPLLSGESTVLGDYDLATDDEHSFSNSSSLFTKTLTVNDQAAFTLGDVDFSFNINAMNNAGVNAEGGVSQASTLITTAYYGGVEVAYTYDAVAAVPEPTSIAILALGLIGFAASRKKSA